MGLWKPDPNADDGRPPSRPLIPQRPSTTSSTQQRSSPFLPFDSIRSDSPRTLPPPTPSLTHVMTPSRSAPYPQSVDWGPTSHPAPSASSTSSKPGWTTRPESSEGSFGTSSRLPPMNSYTRPHTAQYPYASYPSEPPQHPTSGEKHASDATDEGSKKKKKRVALACAECAKRKQKCNRETPCQHCVARRVPELCVPYTRSGTPPPRGVKLEPTADRKPSPREKGGSTVTERPALPTLSVRMARVEDLLNLMVNRVPGLEGSNALDAWRINHPPAMTPERETDGADDDELAPTPPAEHASTRSDKESTPAAEDVGQLDLDTGGRNPLPQSMIVSHQPVPRGLDHHGSPAEQLQRLFHDCGLQPQKVRDLMSDLPPYPLASKLVDWFFAKFNFVRYPIDEKLFRQSFDAVYANGGQVNHTTVLSLPLLYITLAISMRIAPAEWAGAKDEQKTKSLKLYWHSKTAIIIASAVKTEHLQLVETHILTGLYLILMHDRRLAEGWAAFRAGVTTGQAIGLHRDGTKLGVHGLDPVMTEYRRRLWSYLLHADATYSCLLGRPTSIDLDCVDTLPPSNIDIDALRAQPTAGPQTDMEPTYGTYLLLRYKLGVIVAKLARNFQRLADPSGYRDVERLDEEFQDLIDRLPPTFRLSHTDKSRDGDLWYLATHRYYIQTEILHFRIILHRPWLLRKLNGEKYLLSRNVSEHCAVTDYKIRQAFKREVPDFFETLLAGSFRSFNAAMIAGILLLVNPRTPHAQEMKEIVRLFKQEHPYDPKADDFTQKEATIIATLDERRVELESRRASFGERPKSKTSAMRDEGQYGSPSAPLQPSYHPSGYPPSATSSNAAPMLQSPDDDQAQSMLNTWMNQQQAHLGPGADNTLVPFGMYPAQSQPYTYQGLGLTSGHVPHNGFANSVGDPVGQPMGALATAPFGVNLGPQPAVSNGTGANGGYYAPEQVGLNATIGIGLNLQTGGTTSDYWNKMIDEMLPRGPHGPFAG